MVWQSGWQYPAYLDGAPSFPFLLAAVSSALAVLRPIEVKWKYALSTTLSFASNCIIK